MPLGGKKAINSKASSASSYLDGRLAGDEGDKLSEHQLDLVNLHSHEGGEDGVRDGLGILGAGCLAQGELLDDLELQGKGR